MAGLRLRINIGNGGKASSSSLALAQRGEHPQGIVREIHYDPLHGGQFAQGHALDRQLNGRFAAFSISWLNPRAASEQGERI